MIHILLLIAIWMVVTGEFTIANLIVGVVLAVTVRLVSSRQAFSRQYRKWNLRRIFHTIELILFFLWEVVQSGINVAIDVLRPKMRLRPGIVAVPMKGESPLSVTITSNLITMTPGSLTLWFDEKEQILYVHSMQVEDPGTFREVTQNAFIRRVKAVLS